MLLCVLPLKKSGNSVCLILIVLLVTGKNAESVEAGAVDSLQVNYSGTNFSRHTFSLMMRGIIQGECAESIETWETKMPIRKISMPFVATSTPKLSK